MPVPKQVEEAGKKADELLKELYPDGGKEKEGGEKDAKSGEAADPPVQEGAVEPKPKVTETPPATDLEKEQHKYSVLKGKYDTEVNDARGANEFLTKQMMQLKAQNEELNTLIIDMKKKIDGDGGAPAAKEGDPSADVLKLLSQDEIDSMDDEGLTPEVLKLIGKIVGRITEGRDEKAEAKTSNLEQEVNVLKEERIKTAEEKFYDRLKEHVDDWETINKMPDFRTWLSERMPGTNFQRQGILDDSQSRLDAISVIEMFNEFKRAHDIKVSQPKPEVPKPEVPAPEVPAPEIPKKDLESQVNPVTTAPSTGPSTEGKVFTNAEIRKFYSDMAKGVYKNTPDVAKQKEAEILSASIDGRITQ